MEKILYLLNICGHYSANLPSLAEALIISTGISCFILPLGLPCKFKKFTMLMLRPAQNLFSENTF